MSGRAPDPDALLYAAHWAPVLSASGQRLLDRLSDPPVAFLDVGAGTGQLAFKAAARWPDARIVGLDASAGMLSVARQRVRDERPAEAARFEWHAADAAAMPLADESVDVAASAFVMQLVDDRSAVLPEVRRVLRPGGAFGYVTWLAEEPSLPADEAFGDVVAELGLDPARGEAQPEPDDHIESLDEAREELEAAGFERIDVVADELRYAWTAETFLAFKARLEDRDVFDALDGPGRELLRTALFERWAALPDGAFEIRAPLVSAVAHHPGAG